MSDKLCQCHCHVFVFFIKSIILIVDGVVNLQLLVSNFLTIFKHASF